MTIARDGFSPVCFAAPAFAGCAFINERYMLSPGTWRTARAKHAGRPSPQGTLESRTSQRLYREVFTVPVGFDREWVGKVQRHVDKRDACE